MAEAPGSTWQRAAVYILSFAGVLWAIEGINSILGHQLNVLGIYPRELSGLSGVLLWPFLHGNIAHLAVNTTPFIILGWFVALRGAVRFVQVTAMVTLIGGSLVWLLGRSSYHIGASGLVFGYFGFLVAMGIYERSIKALSIATLILFYYGGIIVGILPLSEFVSWEGHLFGLLTGILAARLLVDETASNRD